MIKPITAWVMIDFPFCTRLSSPSEATISNPPMIISTIHAVPMTLVKKSIIVRIKLTRGAEDSSSSK